MKKTLLLSLLSCLSFTLSWAKDDTPAVDANGCIEVNLEKEGTLKKFIKKKDFPTVKTLKLSGKASYEDINLLQEMPNLECLDLSGMPMSNIQTALTDRDKNNRSLPSIPSIQCLVVSDNPDDNILKDYRIDTEYDKTQGNVHEEGYELLSLAANREFNIHQERLRKVNKIKILNCFDKNQKVSGLNCDTIKCNVDKGRNSVLLKEGAVLFERGLTYPNKECQVISTYKFETTSNEDFKNAIIIKSPDLIVDVDTLVIPASLRFVKSMFKRQSYSNCYKSIVFEESDTPIEWHGATLKNPDAVIDINRPINFYLSGFESTVKELHFNKAVINMDYGCIDKGVEKAVFASVPEHELGWGVANHLKKVIIPLGTTNAFKSKGFNSTRLYERGKGGLAYNVKVEKPGTILSYLPSDKLGDIDSLTVTGYLYDTDLKIISSCSFLKYLDLSKTFITHSPETIKEQQKNAEALSGLFSLIGAAADAKYSDYNMSSLDYVYTKGMAELVKDAVNVKKSESGCIIPFGALSDMSELVVAKLPYRAVEIYGKAFMNCPKLEKVELPLYLTDINSAAFNGCSSLKNVTFPSTLTYIGDGAFSGCNSLEVVDLGKCHFKKKNDFSLCGDCKSIKKVIYPEGLFRIYILAGCTNNYNRKEYYFPSSLEELGEIDVSGCTLHFKNPNPPIKRNIENNTIYVPKGSSTAYFGAFGSQNKYIEE